MKKPIQAKYIFKSITEYSTKIWSIVFLFLILLGILLPLGFHFNFHFDNLNFKEENKIVEIYTLIWNIIVSLIAVILYLKRNDNTD